VAIVRLSAIGVEERCLCTLEPGAVLGVFVVEGEGACGCACAWAWESDRVDESNVECECGAGRVASESSSCLRMWVADRARFSVSIREKTERRGLGGGMGGRIVETYSPQYRHAIDIAKVAKE
jgi:hypothetical protein